MTRRATAVVIAFVLTFGLWAGTAKGVVPTLEDLAKLTVTGPIGPSTSAHRNIEEYIKHWVGQITSAKEVKTATKARVALTNGYKVHSSAYWQLIYARICAAQIPSALTGPDRVKHLQASMALVAMPQYTIQPTLEKMARHSNPAVRYWAARGYRSAAKRMVLYDARFKTMLATLERLGAEEPGPTLVVVFRALGPYPGANRYQVAQMRKVLDEIWLARCKDILAGRAGVIEAYRKAVGFLAPAEGADKKQTLQLLTDTLEAASAGFVRPENQKGPVGTSMMDLLTALEAKLVEIVRAGKKETPIQDILADDDVTMAEKPGEIRLKVNEYWKPLLAERGVKPRIVGPTTKPAPK